MVEEIAIFFYIMPPCTIKSLLTMSKESKNISKARRVIRKAKSTLNPQQVVDDIRTNIPNARLNNCKYLAGITRMYLNNEFCDQKTTKKK